jgi:hypothetical protein
MERFLQAHYKRKAMMGKVMEKRRQKLEMGSGWPCDVTFLLLRLAWNQFRSRFGTGYSTNEPGFF